MSSKMLFWSSSRFSLRPVQWLAFLSVLLPVLFFSPGAAAQSYAALHGTITDTTGAVIPGATVTVLNTSTGISTVRTTDKSGYYVFTQLQVGGPYTVTVTAVGFKNYVQTGLTLNVNDNREVSGKLSVGGSATQTVEVSATAVQVETSNTQLEQIVTSQQIEQIPLEGRDASGLQKLQPGVVESSDRFGTFSSNGNQTPQNSYLLDGIDINDPALEAEGIAVNPDALEEENIVTSTMNPEFARNSGSVINQVIKHGTNSFHGSGFEFYRDTFLNNGNYFSATRPQFHQNLYGGTLGGPVLRNKLFFFVAYQGLRNRTGATTVQQTLDADQFAGDESTNYNYYTGFSNNDNADCAPYSNCLSPNPTPFSVNGHPAGTPWNVAFNNGTASVPATVNIPTSTWNSVATTLTNKFIPAANFGGLDANGQQYQYNFNAADTSAQDQGIIRADYTPTANDSIWASSIFMSSPSTSTLTFGGGSFPGFGSTAGDHFKLFSASWTHTFSPTLLNELRASYFRNPFGAVEPAQVVAPSSFGFNISPQDPQSGVPYIAIGDYFSLGFSFEGPQPRLDTNLLYADNVSWVRGNHNLKLGASWEIFRVRNPFDVYNNGYFSFGGGGEYSSGDPLIDFALGVPDSYYQTNNGFINAVSSEDYAYAQDNWKVSPDLTFNYGIVWDVEVPNQNHQWGGLGVVCWANSSTVSTVFPGASPGLSWPGDPGCNQAGGVPTRYGHFAPRIGFAWSPSHGPSALIGAEGSHQFSLRAGFGMYYNRDQEEQSLQNLEDPPFVQVNEGATVAGGSPAFANPFADVTGNAAASTSNPFPLAPITPSSTINWSNYLFEELAVFDKSYNVPYTFNYNLNIQRAIGANMVAQLGYVGSVSHRLSSWHEGDPITSAGHAACLAGYASGACNSEYPLYYPQYMADTAALDGYPYYLSVGDQDTEGNSNYNSLQALLTKAPSHGLAFTLAYTYSHALDDGSGYESSTGAAGRVLNYTPGFTWLNYGDSDFDARHRLAASYVYTVPATGFLRKNAFVRETLSGWGIAGVTALQTGFPVGVYLGTNHSLWCSAFSYFGCADVPDWSGAAIQKDNIRSSVDHQYFNTSSFSDEPVGTFGNTKRNFFHGPGYNYTNLQLSKDVHLSPNEARYVQLRLEAFNVFNHANFAGPNGNFSSTGFGQVTSVMQTADPNGDPSPGRAIQLAGKFYF